MVLVFMASGAYTYMHVFTHESNLFKEFVSSPVLREGEEISDARLLLCSLETWHAELEVYVELYCTSLIVQSCTTLQHVATVYFD